MSKKVTIERIANELGVSKTTVSKAINNCPGINSDTKRTVMQAVSKYGYLPLRPAQDIAVILPSVPDYFWGSLRKNLFEYSKASKIACKFYVYPNLHDTNDALRCINQATEEGASALILASPDSYEIRKVLESISERILIIFIEEFLDIKNTFCICENSFSEGYALAEKYIYDFPDSEYFALLRITDFYTEKTRVSGFLQALKDNKKILLHDIKTDSSTHTQSAWIARELSKTEKLPDCILCPSGNLSRAALAVKKLRAKKVIHCIGFDINTKSENNTYGDILTHILIQDLNSQAKKAIECAEGFIKENIFPDKKYMYIGNIRYK